MPTQRHVAVLVLGGIGMAIVWRLWVAPVVLGSFDPADMPHRERAFLSLGNAGVGLFFALALADGVRLHAGTTTARPARIAAWLGGAAAASAVGATAGLVWWEGAGVLLRVYVLLMGAAWAVCGYASVRRFAGALRWASGVTGMVYALAAGSVFLGAFVIFVMTVAALPYGLAMLLTRLPVGLNEAGGGQPD